MEGSAAEKSPVDGVRCLHCGVLVVKGYSQPAESLHSSSVMMKDFAGSLAGVMMVGDVCCLHAYGLQQQEQMKQQ